MAYKKKTTRKAPTRRRTTKAKKTTTTRRRRRATKNKGLSDFFTNAQAKNTMSNMANGAVGAGIYYAYKEKVELQNDTPEKRGVIAAAGAFLVGATMGKANIASGIIGAAAFDYFSAKDFLNDPMPTEMARQQYVNEQTFYDNLPETLSDGEMMNLADQNEMDLQDPDYLPAYYYGY